MAPPARDIRAGFGKSDCGRTRRHDVRPVLFSTRHTICRTDVFSVQVDSFQIAFQVSEVTNMKFRLRAGMVLLALPLLTPAVLLANGTIPKGTAIAVVTNQAVSSKTAKLGQTVTGTVAKDVVVGGKVVIRKGSSAKLSVSSVQASGRLSTPAKLYLQLRTITVNGETYAFSTSSSGRSEGGKGKRDAGFIGGGATGGAIIGALAGGGKGAAIGAAAGAGAGTAGAAATGKKEVEYPAETRLTFTTKTDTAIK